MIPQCIGKIQSLRTDEKWQRSFLEGDAAILLLLLFSIEKYCPGQVFQYLTGLSFMRFFL